MNLAEQKVLGLRLITLISIILLVGCISVKPRYTSCQRETDYAYKKFSSKYEVRIGHGYFQNTPHRWLEYYKDGEWLVEDDAIWFINDGYPVDMYDDYEVVEYEYK